MRLLRNDILCFFLSIAILLPLAGCDSGIYSAEKRFWHASKAYNALMKNLEKASASDYQKVIDAYREITIRYPMWPNSAQAQFGIGQLYAIQNNLPKAREEFAVILKDYTANVDMCATVLFIIAVIYEKEDDWAKAQETLNKITSDYSNTGTAFQVPVHIAEYYKSKGQTAEAETAYAAALDKYKSMIKNSPKTYGALIALDLAMTCYSDQEKWNDALEYLGGLAHDYPDTLLAPKSLFITGAIYQEKLNQPQKALEYYREITDKYSKTLFAKAAQQQIELINKPK